MPAHNAELSDSKSILRILLALVLENGGELRIKATSYDGIDKGRLLTVDFDDKKSQIVLRATSAWGRAVVVQPESHAWVQPQTEAPLERARVRAEAIAQRRAIPSDEQLADMEESIQRNQDVAKDVTDGKVPIRLRTIPPNKSPV
jgi:hypothetical protein